MLQMHPARIVAEAADMEARPAGVEAMVGEEVRRRMWMVGEERRWTLEVELGEVTLMRRAMKGTGVT